MDLISLAIKRPMAIVAAVLMIVVLGLVAMQTIPIQLTPDVRRPVLVIYTWWRGVAPAEVEREITNRIEQELTGIEGLELISSQSQLGRSRIVLEFKVDQNMDRAFMLVSNRLNGVSDLPDEASEPNIRTSTSDDVPIARFAVTRLDGNELDRGERPAPPTAHRPACRCLRPRRAQPHQFHHPSPRPGPRRRPPGLRDDRRLHVFPAAETRLPAGRQPQFRPRPHPTAARLQPGHHLWRCGAYRRGAQTPLDSGKPGAGQSR